MKISRIIMAAATAVLLPVASFAAVAVSPTIIGANSEFWSFGTLEGSDTAADTDYVSDTTLDIATGADTYFIDFFVTPTDGMLSLDVTNSNGQLGATTYANLLTGGDAGTYELFWNGDLLSTVTAGAAQEIATFGIDAGGTGTLKWVWDTTGRGQVSTNVTVNPVPVPAAGFLLLGGLGGLAAMKRRKKA